MQLAVPRFWLNHAGLRRTTKRFLNRVRWFDSGRGHSPGR